MITDKQRQDIRMAFEEQTGYSIWSEEHFNDVGFSDKYAQYLEAELERVKKLFQAAKNYIDVCPCDPDITTEQLEAWNKYQELLKEKE